jgi:FtsZ-interacting cell division protein ZipA
VGQTEEEPSAVDTAVEGARGISSRLLWVVGTILAVVGAVTTIFDQLHHHHGIGPYLLAGAFLLLFLLALDMWRVERSKARRARRTVRRLSSRVDRHEENVRELERDSNAWRRMQAEEAAANSRLSEELGRLQQQVQQPQVSGGTLGVASTGPAQPPIFDPPEPPPTPRKRPRHSRKRPPENQPGLFDQDGG